MAEAIESPAAQLAALARTEAALGRVVRAAVGSLLAQVRSDALGEGLWGLTAARVYSSWEEGIRGALAAAREAGRIGEDQFTLAVPLLLASPLPDAVYDAARTVLTVAAEQGWDADYTAEQMALVLDVDEPGVVTAAARRRASMSDALARTGATWRPAMDTLITSTASSIRGFQAAEQIRAGGYAQKRWVSRRDARVRETHVEADGQTVDAAQPFAVGVARLMYPGDPAGPAGEVINCRCVMVGVRSALAPIFLAPGAFD